MLSAKHWRDRAEECITLAEKMNDREAKMLMLRCAAGYFRMADKADEERRSNQSSISVRAAGAGDVVLIHRGSGTS